MNIRRSLSALLLTSIAGTALAQPGPWYQVEVSIFAHEATDLSQERWGPQTGRALEEELGTHGQIRLTSLLDFLDLEDWSTLDPAAATRAASRARTTNREEAGDAGQSGEASPTAPLIEPQAFDPVDISLPDYTRDAFLRLPASEQNFRQTNQALERSPDYRLLWHAAWRQPMEQASGTPYIEVEGGRELEGQPELTGTLRAYFSPDTTRVILDAELWRTVFENGEALRLPMQQARPMISNEFHYLDHPAIGIVAEVFRYERPPLSPGR